MALHKTKGFQFKKKKKSSVQLRLRGLNKKQRIGLIAVVVFLLSVIVFCCVQIFNAEAEYKLGRDTYSAIETVVVTQPDKSSESPYLTIDHAKLKSINGDYIGWLNIPDTKISYPMVQGNDNDYYLRWSFTGEYLYSGVVFMDSNCSRDFSSDNSILYGHNMKDGSMFSAIANYKNQSFWDGHQEIQIYQPDGTICVYRAFAFYITDMDSDTYQFRFQSTAGFASWQDKMQTQSWYTSDARNPASRIITLSTCVNSDDNSRYVLQAVLVDTIDAPQKQA